MKITQLENQPWKRRIPAIASREIVAAEVCYHRTCYNGRDESLEDRYAHLES